MNYFVEIGNDYKVIQAIVIAEADCGNKNYPLSEQIGQEFIAQLGLTGTWLQTSIDGLFRGRYASVGTYYDPATDVFYEKPQ